MNTLLIPPQARAEGWTCWTELRDGRVINLTGLTVEAAVAKLRAAGVTPSNILYTTHVVSLEREQRIKKDRIL